MDKIISEYRSIAEMYSILLIRQREIQRTVEKGAAVCCHCNHPRSTHLSDQRCSVSALSRQFRNVRHDEAEKIVRAIELTEELRGL